MLTILCVFNIKKIKKLALKFAYLFNFSYRIFVLKKAFKCFFVVVDKFVK